MSDQQAAIARKYGLTRAAISKRLRDMRKGEFLGGLEIYFFGGKEDVSEKARTRAIRVHKHKQQLKETIWKTQTPSETITLRPVTQSEEINLAYKQLELMGEALVATGQAWLKKAICIGELLKKQKDQTPHGEWFKWIESNLSFSRQTADNFLSLGGKSPTR